MNKLLSANFFRLRKNKCFRGSLAFMFVIGIASPLLRYRDMKQSGYINNLDNGFFMCALFIGIILAVFCSLFIGTEHNDGTIRNKIIVGQKRETIYLSNMVTCSIIAITMCIVFFVPYLSVGIPLLGFFVADMKMIVMIGITVLVLSVTFASLFTLVAMLSQNKAIIAVACILFSFGLLFAGAMCNRMLDAPKTIPAYSIGEIAKLCGVSVRTVQYYDERGILIPSELSEGGRRLYSEDDYKKLKIICFLRDAGISIKSIGELLSESNPTVMNRKQL